VCFCVYIYIVVNRAYNLLYYLFIYLFLNQKIKIKTKKNEKKRREEHSTNGMRRKGGQDKAFREREREREIKRTNEKKMNDFNDHISK
jgi:hypothetical protein